MHELSLCESLLGILEEEARRQRDREPAFVRHTLARLAELRGAAVDEVAGQTAANTRQLFDLDGR